MNALEALAGLNWWHVAGWTMLHYLWVGALVGVVAAVLRFAVRRASANVRYAVAVGSLVVLAVAPVGIGMGVGFQVSGVREVVEGSGGVRFVELSTGDNVRTDSKPVEPVVIDLAERVSEAGPVSGATGSASVDLEPMPQIVKSQSTQQLVVSVAQTAAGYLPYVWIVGAPVTLVLLVTGVVGAERLRRESRILRDGPVAEAAARMAESLKIGRRVTVAVCERIAAPVLVGIVRPMILLPPAVLTGWSPDEIEMVLLHELAHVRRWDNLVNLLQRLVEAVLFFQPAVWLVSGWVRREREACCDAVVVGRTNRPQAYAELLVEFAAMMSEPSEPGRPRPRSDAFTRGRGRPGSQGALVSAMAAGPLRGRIRGILGIEDDPLLISGKSLGVVMSGLLLAATLVVLNLTTRTQAEEERFTTEDTEEVKAEVPFAVGASRFADGDSITITQVRGTSSKFVPRGIYWIEGTYKLASRGRASLSAFVTARNAGEGRTSIDKKQTTIVERGSGGFALELTMPYEGWPHVSFYPAKGGEGFGGVYFGTGDSVLKKWWGEKEFTTEGTGRKVAAKGGEARTGFIVRSKFVPSEANKLETRKYEIADSSRAVLDLDSIAAVLDADKSKPRPVFGHNWSHDFTRLQIVAPKEGQEFVASILRDSVAEATKVFTTEDTEGTEKKIDIAKKRSATQNNLKSLAIALLNYYDSRKRFAPRAQFDADGKPLLSWRVMVLPYLDPDHAKLYDEFRLDEPWDSEHNRKLIARMPKVFRNPQIDRPGMTNYLAVVGEECMFDGSAQGIRIAQVADGTSRTIALVEADADRAVEWTKPADWEFDRERPTAGLGGLWPDRWYAAWVDGSIRSVSNKEQPDHVGIQFTRAGGETESLAESAGRAGRMMRMDDGMGRGMGMGGEMMGGRGGMGMEGRMAAGGRGMMGRYGAMGMAGGEFGGEMGIGAAPAAVVPMKKFPTLEEQKLADLAWKQMGLELAPIGEEDLKRVRALGYDGGLRVTGRTDRVIGQPLEIGNILVGLHVWPMMSLRDVANVLNRDDLSELSPLKYYIVAQQPVNEQVGEDEVRTVMKDAIETGRISVSLPTRQSTRPTTLTHQQMLEQMRKGALTIEADTQQHSTRGKSSKANPEELEVLREHVKVLESQHEQLDALYKARKPGGLRETREVAAFELLRAQGELALSEGDREQALRRLQQARDHAEEAFKAVSAAYTAGRITHDMVLQTANSLSEIKRRLIHLQNADTRLEEVAEPQEKVIAPTDESSTLRYDGKTFDEWRSAWKTELSTEKRLEAVKALAAFGANGKGKEAAEAIVEVVGQYDLRAWLTTNVIDDDPRNLFFYTCLSALGAPGYDFCAYQIPADDVLPALVAATESDDLRTRRVATRILLNWGRDPRAAQALLKLIYDSDAAVRELAFAALRSAPGSDQMVLEHLQQVIKDAKSPETVARAKKALESIRKSLEKKQRNDLFGPSPTSKEARDETIRDD